MQKKRKPNVFHDARRVIGLSEVEFDREMLRLLRRLKLLDEVKQGGVRLRKVTVTRHRMTWTVKAKTRTYTRYIAPAGYGRKNK